MPVGASHADHARRLSAEALVEYGYSLVILAGPGGGQTLGCKLDECLDQRRNVSAARIHGIKPANRRRVVVENAAQPPVPDRRLGDLVGQLSDAVTCNPPPAFHWRRSVQTPRPFPAHAARPAPSERCQSMGPQ